MSAFDVPVFAKAGEGEGEEMERLCDDRGKEVGKQEKSCCFSS